MWTCLDPTLSSSLFLRFYGVKRFKAEGRGPLGAVGEDRQQGCQREVKTAAFVPVAARLELRQVGERQRRRRRQRRTTLCRLDDDVGDRSTDLFESPKLLFDCFASESEFIFELFPIVRTQNTSQKFLTKSKVTNSLT